MNVEHLTKSIQQQQSNLAETYGNNDFEKLEIIMVIHMLKSSGTKTTSEAMRTVHLGFNSKIEEEID